VERIHLEANTRDQDNHEPEPTAVSIASLGARLDEEERIFFAEAPHDLLFQKSDSQLGTAFAIIDLVGALGGSFLKV
jgi:hypothetical protein